MDEHLNPSKGPTALAPPSGEEFAERRRRALEQARARGYDGMIVWSRGATNADANAGVLYLANHQTPCSHLADFPGSSSRGHCAVVLVADAEPVLVTDYFEYEPGIVAVDDVRTTTRVPSTVAEICRDLGLARARIAVDGTTALMHTSYLELRAGMPDATFEFEDDILRDLRAVKSAHEIELMRDASRIGCEWMAACLAAIEPGRTEGEIIGAGLQHLAACGGWPLDVAIAAGPAVHRHRHRQGLPTWDATYRLRAGDQIHLDLWGPVAHNYQCDIHRTTVVGADPTAQQLRYLEASIALIEHLLAGMRPGIAFSDLHARAEEWLRSEGFGGDDSGLAKQFGNFGHSLGLAVEAPLVIADEAAMLTENMVLAVEGSPGNAAHFEHIVLVTASGVEILTDLVAARPWSA